MIVIIIKQTIKNTACNQRKKIENRKNIFIISLIKSLIFGLVLESVRQNSNQSETRFENSEVLKKSNDKCVKNSVLDAVGFRWNFLSVTIRFPGVFLTGEYSVFILFTSRKTSKFESQTGRVGISSLGKLTMVRVK